MARRGNEPDEAIGPTLDGFDYQDLRLPRPEPETPMEEPEDSLEVDEVIEHPVALICGSGVVPGAVARLAEECGFIVEHALAEGDPQPEFSSPAQIHRVASFDNFIVDHEIDRNFFVCVFLEDEEDTEAILIACLESQARYIGVWANDGGRERIFANLRAAGVPDAELAAVHCPIGLNLGASTPEQMAVAVVAEMLAARNGTMQRLLRED